MELDKEILAALSLRGSSSVRIIARTIQEAWKSDWVEWVPLSCARVRNRLLAMEKQSLVVRENSGPGERHWWKIALSDTERAVLARLAGGDAIVFSQDGDEAWFSGTRDFVGREVITLREKGLTKREVTDEENYRGMSEQDVISDAGRAVL